VIVLSVTSFPSGPTKIQTPTADPITSNISNQARSCPAGYAGWDRDVNKHVVDQNGAAIQVAGQAMTESYTIGSPNGLNLSGIATGSASTDSTGSFADDYWVCATACPGSTGTTQATQQPYDVVPGASTKYTLRTNSVVYKCGSISVNGN
jgi:hypothetical protein